MYFNCPAYGKPSAVMITYKDSIMDAEFITGNSKLTVQNGTIWEKTLAPHVKSYWLHSFMLTVFLFAFALHKALTSGAVNNWILVGVSLLWLSPHLSRLYQLLFIKVWRWYVPLSEIKDVSVAQANNELEETVWIRLHSGRKKTYVFRKSEQQAQPFVALVQLHIALNPAMP